MTCICMVYVVSQDVAEHAGYVTDIQGNMMWRYMRVSA